MKRTKVIIGAAAIAVLVGLAALVLPTSKPASAQFTSQSGGFLSKPGTPPGLTHDGTSVTQIDFTSTGTGIRAPDGSASAPSYSFISDTDSGMYWASANQVRLTAGGSNIAFFSTVNLLGSGLATISGGQVDLQVAAGASGGQLFLVGRRAAGDAPADVVVSPVNASRTGPVMTVQTSAGGARHNFYDNGDYFHGPDLTANEGTRRVYRTVQTTDGTVTAIYTLTLADETVYTYQFNCAARRSDAAGRATTWRYGSSFRASAGSATETAAEATPSADQSSGTITAAPTITVSGNDLSFNAVGTAGQTIQWGCAITVTAINAA